MQSSWNSTQITWIVACSPCKIPILGESARTYVWEKSQNVRWAGGKPTAPHDNHNTKYIIRKLLKFYTNNINLDLFTMCDTNFCKKRARPPKGSWTLEYSQSYFDRKNPPPPPGGVSYLLCSLIKNRV